MTKSNLDSMFKNNKKFETDGIWLDMASGISFLVRRFGGYNSLKVKAALAKHYKPYARLIDLGNFPEDREREIMIRVFAESSILDWKGVEIDGKEEKFSPEVAVKLLVSLPELAEQLLSYSSESKNFREDLVDLGKS